MKSLSQKYLFFILGLLIFVALEFRLVYINNPLWYDEAHSVLIANMGFPFEINKYLFETDLQHTPFYFYLLHFWIKIFGQNDIILKIFSLIFSLCSIPLIYSIGKKILNTQFAIISALLLSFNTFNIIYATEVRMYSLTMFLALLSIKYLYDYINDENFELKNLVKLTLINFILPYTFIGSFIFILAQVLSVIFVFSKCKNLKNYFISNAILFIGLIPYFIIILGYHLKRSEYILSHVTDFSLANIFGIFQNFLAPSCGSIFWATLNPFYIDANSLFLVFIPLFISCWLIYLAVKYSDKNILLLILITFISFIICTCFAINKTIVLAPRYLIFISPILLLLVTYGLTKVQKNLLIFFLVYYCITSTYFVYTDNTIKELKKSSLISPIKYIAETGLTNKDMVIMPFASSVISHYTDKNSPQIPRIEALQELRIYNNKNIYSDEIIEKFKTQKINNVFKEIVTSPDYISENFHNYILNKFVNPVEKNHYILLAIFASDSYALMSQKDLQDMIKSTDFSTENILNLVLAKYFIDIHKIIQEKATLISTKEVDNNVYLLYKKR